MKCACPDSIENALPDENGVGPRRTVPGFTLIELLVAFTIFALVSVAAFTGLSISLSSWSRANDAVDRLREQQTSLDLMREQLRSALPFEAQSVRGSTPIAFVGSPQDIEFVSPFSLVDGSEAGPRWVRWSLGDDPRTPRRVEISESRIRIPEGRPEPQPYWAGEADIGREFEFRFYRPGANGLPGQWLDFWDSQNENQLPAAVAFRTSTGERSELITLDSAPASRGGGRVR